MIQFYIPLDNTFNSTISRKYLYLIKPFYKVVEVPYDASKPQNRDFVRVLIRFDISKPLRRAKVVNLPRGSTATIHFDYERVQKRCYRCQRLTHEQEACLLSTKEEKEQSAIKKERGGFSVHKPSKIIAESDPIFGVLKDNQVGINPLTGRLRITEEVLEGMRQYIFIPTGDDRLTRESRVRKSLAEVEKDPIAQKTMLRLEPAAIISQFLDKGKGLVFDYDSSSSHKKLLASLPQIINCCQLQ